MNPLITLYYNKHIQGARRKNMLMEGVWWGDAKITDFNQKKKEKNYRLSCSPFYIKWLLKLGYETASQRALVCWRLGLQLLVLLKQVNALLVLGGEGWAKTLGCSFKKILSLAPSRGLTTGWIRASQYRLKPLKSWAKVTLCFTILGVLPWQQNLAEAACYFFN